MMAPTFISDIAVVLGVGAFTAIVMRLLRQSSVVAYLLAGFVVGPYIPIPLFAEPGRVESMAEFGVLLVMFAIGLEFRIRRFLQVLPVSGVTALLQMSFLFGCGLTVGNLLDWSMLEAVFLGAAVCISSTMVVSKLFDQSPVDSSTREFTFGVLVIQDLVAVVLIAMVSGIASGQGLESGALLATLGQLAVVLAGLVIGGMLFVPRVVRLAARFESQEILVVVVTGLCFCTAVLAEHLGYSVALGAFVAGVLVAESGEEKVIEPLIRPLRDLFAAVFFVSVGMSVDPVAAVAVLPQSLVLVVVVILAQFLSVSSAGLISGNGLRRSVWAGLALGQVGEFSFIIAGIGIAAGIVRGDAQSMLVTVAIITAFTTPLLFDRADGVVGWVQRRLTGRMLHILRLYERWFESVRSGAAQSAGRPSMRRAVRVILVDSVVLLGLTAAAVMSRNELGGALVEHLELPRTVMSVILVAGWLTVSVPFLIGLVRSTASLARLVSRSVVSSAAAATRPATPLLQGTYRTLVWLAVMLGVGIPLSATLEPVTGAAPFVLVVVGALLAAGFYLWRGDDDMESGFRSQAERVARLLARQGAPSPGADPERPSPIPGFDLVFGFAILPGSRAVGKTLIELNLRALSGATVVAIRRGDENVLLPTGREALQAGDVLGIAGTEDAIRKANSLLCVASE